MRVGGGETGLCPRVTLSSHGGSREQVSQSPIPKSQIFWRTGITQYVILGALDTIFSNDKSVSMLPHWDQRPFLFVFPCTGKQHIWVGCHASRSKP